MTDMRGTCVVDDYIVMMGRGREENMKGWTLPCTRKSDNKEESFYMA